MSGMGERQMKILKALERKGYYELENQHDLVACRKIYAKRQDIGMKRVCKGRWYIFTKRGFEQIVIHEDISPSDLERLRRYAKRMFMEVEA